MKQAYVPSDEDLTRDIYIKPKKNDRIFLGVTEHQVLKLKRPLYGTCNASDYWALTMDRHMKCELGTSALV